MILFVIGIFIAAVAILTWWYISSTKETPSPTTTNIIDRGISDSAPPTPTSTNTESEIPPKEIPKDNMPLPTTDSEIPDKLEDESPIEEPVYPDKPEHTEEDNLPIISDNSSESQRNPCLSYSYAVSHPDTCTIQWCATASSRNSNLSTCQTKYSEECENYLSLGCPRYTNGNNRSIFTDDQLLALPDKLGPETVLPVDIYSNAGSSSSYLGLERVKTKHMFLFVNPYDPEKVQLTNSDLIILADQTKYKRYPDTAFFQIGISPLDTTVCDSIRSRFGESLCGILENRYERDRWTSNRCTPNWGVISESCPPPPPQFATSCDDLNTRYHIDPSNRKTWYVSPAAGPDYELFKKCYPIGDTGGPRDVPATSCDEVYSKYNVIIGDQSTYKNVPQSGPDRTLFNYCISTPVETSATSCIELFGKYNINPNDPSISFENYPLTSSEKDLAAKCLPDRFETCLDVLDSYPQFSSLPTRYKEFVDDTCRVQPTLQFTNWESCAPSSDSSRPWSRIRGLRCVNAANDKELDINRCDTSSVRSNDLIETCTYQSANCIGPYDSHPFCEDQVERNVSSFGGSRCQTQDYIARTTGECPLSTTGYPEPELADPCSPYSGNDTISPACYRKLWNDSGCTTYAPEPSSDQLSTQKKSYFERAFALLTGKQDPDSLRLCYGEDSSKWPIKTPSSITPVPLRYNFTKYQFWYKGASRDPRDARFDIILPDQPISGLLYKNKIDSLTLDSYRAEEGLNDYYNIDKTVIQDPSGMCTALRNGVDWNNPTPQQVYNFLVLNCDRQPPQLVSCASEQKRTENNTCEWLPCYKNVEILTPFGTSYEPRKYYQVEDPEQIRDPVTHICELPIQKIVLELVTIQANTLMLEEKYKTFAYDQAMLRVAGGWSAQDAANDGIQQAIAFRNIEKINADRLAEEEKRQRDAITNYDTLKTMDYDTLTNAQKCTVRYGPRCTAEACKSTQCNAYYIAPKYQEWTSTCYCGSNSVPI